MKDKIVALMLVAGLLTECKQSPEEKKEALIATLTPAQKEAIAFRHDQMLVFALENGLSLPAAFKMASQTIPADEKDTATFYYMKEHANFRFNQAIRQVTDYIHTPMPDGQGGVQMVLSLQTRYVYQPNFPAKLRAELQTARCVATQPRPLPVNGGAREK